MKKRTKTFGHLHKEAALSFFEHCEKNSARKAMAGMWLTKGGRVHPKSFWYVEPMDAPQLIELPDAA